MPNYSQISRHCPFWFVPNTTTPGIHFGDDWACKQIKSFETKAYYTQKWLRQKTTTIQCQSTVVPDDLKVYNKSQAVVKSIAWTNVSIVPGVNVYECTVDLSDIPEATYWLYQKFALLSYNAEFISEAISSKDYHPFVKAITYSNTYNNWDVVWSTGMQMTFCVECEIMNMKPEAEVTSYVDQTRDVFVLDGVPYRTYKLEIGDARGVTPYILDIINRIFCCDQVSIEGKSYVRNSGAKLEINQPKNYPLAGGTLEITEAKNLYSLQHNDLTPLAPGIVTTYKIEGSWFGGSNVVEITDIDSP